MANAWRPSDSERTLGSRGNSIDHSTSNDEKSHNQAQQPLQSPPSPTADSPGRDAEKEAQAPKPAAPTASEAPDGGAQAWLCVLGGWCTAFTSFGWLNSIGVFQEYYQRDLLSDYNASTVSWIPSLQIFFILGMGPVVGTLFDNYGPRWLVLIGSFLHVFGIMMTSIGTEYYQILLAQGICSAIGASMLFQPPLSCVGGWFNKKRGAAFGILSTGASIGGVVFPIMVTHLIRTVGYGWAMRICAFLILGLLVIANVTVKSRLPPRPHKPTLAQFVKPFRELDYILLTAGFFCLSYGIFAPLNFITVEATHAGMDPSLVQYLIPILNAASMFGRLFAGFLGDKIGRYNIFIMVCYLSGVWILGLWIPTSSDPALIAFAILFGFSSGAYVSLVAPLTMQISPMAEIGFRTGMVFFVSSIGGLTTNPINGALIDSPLGYTAIKIFPGVFCLVGTTFIVAARVRRVGWKLKIAF